ncbi:MAG: glycosyltransferase family 1 protein [Chromatiales bacterium]|jgi:glycosyltransferase involved in cell wall biosynthesis
MRLLLATDAWHPQVNGVVRTLSQMVEQLRQQGHEVEVVAAGDYPSVPLPTYAEIRISVWLRGLTRRIEEFAPDAIHISTEGPIGQFVRRFCLKRGYVFTTSFHTRFPEYISERVPIPLEWTYPFVRSFHRPAFRTLVPTQNLVNELRQRDFEHLVVWGRGVDTELFQPQRQRDLGLPGPVLLNVGRVAPEKNLQAFLDIDFPGSKVVVGDGPQLAELKRKYPDVHFPGMKQGVELAEYFASADVFVFPSRTDTFGLVMLEAAASGTPVAAYPVTGPVDVLAPGKTGVMHEDLAVAVEQALQLDRESCRAHALQHAWPAIAQQFLDALMPINSDKAGDVYQAQHRLNLA